MVWGDSRRAMTGNLPIKTLPSTRPFARPPRINVLRVDGYGIRWHQRRAAGTAALALSRGSSREPRAAMFRGSGDVENDPFIERRTFAGGLKHKRRAWPMMPPCQ